VLFFIGFVVSGLMSSNHEDVSMAIIPLFVGGIPAAVGFGLLVAGRSCEGQPP
jgi:hypothetical protein